MKFIITSFVVLLAVGVSYGQDDLGDWYFTLGNAPPKINEENLLIISVDLPDGWGLYSSDFTAGTIGPTPTVFDFGTSSGLQTIDPVRSTKPLTVEDEGLGLRFTYFVSKAEFRQCFRLIKPNARIKGIIKGHLFQIETGKTKSFEKSVDLAINTTTTN